MVTKLISIDMKKSGVLSILLCIMFLAPLNGQVGKFLKNVGNSVKSDLLGNDKNKPGPEPPCACDPADLIADIGKYKIDYSELNISVFEDGRVLLQDKTTSYYYIVKEGSTEGPIKENDPRVKQFQTIVQKDDYNGALLALYKDYISPKGDKLIITFDGKTYGPFAKIDKFGVTRSKDKFAAMVTETVVMTEDDNKKMEAAIKNAKTQEEQMQLAMKYSQQVQQKMMAGGGPQAISSRLISNIPISPSDEVTLLGGSFYTTVKYDDILFVTPSKIADFQGKTLFSLPSARYNPDGTYVSSDNKLYAFYDYGTLTISDGRKLTELFNPRLMKQDGKIYLAYMYFSPKRNAIMQCKIPF
jgi:hypothetical protein